MLKFHKNLTKAETKFFKFILRSIQNNNLYLKLYENEISNIINPYNKDKIISNFILKIIDKRIIYIFKNINNEQIEMHFPIITNLKIENQVYYIALNKELLNLLEYNENTEIPTNDNFEIYFELSNDLNRRFIELLLYQNILNNNFTINLQSLKEKLGLENMYNRFYDFEKIILIPFIEDVNNNTKLHIEYKLIRETKKLNSKVIGIRFILKKINIKNELCCK